MLEPPGLRITGKPYLHKKECNVLSILFVYILLISWVDGPPDVKWLPKPIIYYVNATTNLEI